MQKTDFSKGSMWGMRPEKFDVLQRSFQEMQGATIDIDAQKLAESMNAEKDYEIYDGVAVIPITGAITKRSSFFSFLFGGTSVLELTAMLQAAITDPKVEAILLDVDSPGGTVSGINELSALIHEARSEKPIVAYSGGMMASAAYWLGSSADKVVLGKTADAGSIGVLMIHTDCSEMDKMHGVKVTYLTAGKYKALGNDAEPLSDLAKETFSKELEYIYSIFVGDVARNRNVSAEEVKENMADGRIFIGEQAVEIGLADYIGTIDDAHGLAKELASNIKSGGLPSGKGLTMLFGKEKAVAPSNTAELEAAFPELAAQLKDQGAKSVDVAGTVKAAVDEAVKAETGRILGLFEAQFGEEAKKGFAAVVAAGTPGELFSAYKLMNPAQPAPSAEDKKKAEMLAAIQGAGAANPGAGDGSGSGVILSVEEQAKKDFATKQDIRDEFKSEGQYVAFKLAEAAGKIKILIPKG
jgi:signal peptide peptidase SppA